MMGQDCFLQIGSDVHGVLPHGDKHITHQVLFRVQVYDVNADERSGPGSGFQVAQ